MYIYIYFFFVIFSLLASFFFVAYVLLFRYRTYIFTPCCGDLTVKSKLVRTLIYVRFPAIHTVVL